MTLFAVKSQALPGETLLEPYRIMPGAYTDCFSLSINSKVAHSEFVIAFYTSFLFKIERAILKKWVNKPSTDAQVKELAEGRLDDFAAWSVEQRQSDQLLMCDFMNRTRSWLMVGADHYDTTDRSTLYFGSAIVPAEDSGPGERRIGTTYRLLLGFHKLYSRLLLASAGAKLKKS